MKDNHIIEIHNLSKAYKLYNKKSDRLREAIDLSGKQYSRVYYALKDVSFSVEKGETFGILGTNGSGKSTLLKILSGVVAATSGYTEVGGKISALLELGAGFNPEYTGLENIELHGTMMGYTPEQMEQKRQEIIEFADIGQYIDQPVKNYSSGMFARLAFAAAINVEPEILIVDEILSVGDMRFQIKCMDRMKEMMENGTTILFVSHDISAVRRFCKRSLWLHEGVLKAIGDTNEVADLYADFLKCNDLSIIENHITKAEDDDIEPFAEEEHGDAIAAIKKFEVSNRRGEKTDILDFNEPVVVTVTYDVYDIEIQNPVLGVALYSIDDDYICGLNTLLDRIQIPWKYGRNRFSISYPYGLCVLGGKYYFDCALYDKTATVSLDYKKCVKEIVTNSGYVAEGKLVLPHEWIDGGR